MMSIVIIIILIIITTMTSTGDGWAIDNFKVFRYFPSDWHKSSAFRQNVVTALDFIQRAQCCFDTEHCETRLSFEQMNDCYNFLPSYNGRRYLIRGVEIFICVVAFINLLKFVYVTVENLLTTKRLPFQDEWEELGKVDRIMQFVPARYFMLNYYSHYSFFSFFFSTQEKYVQYSVQKMNKISITNLNPLLSNQNVYQKSLYSYVFLILLLSIFFIFF